MDLTPEETSRGIREMAKRNPAIARMVNLIDSTIPYGLEGMVKIQFQFKELLNFEGTDEEFTEKLIKQRDNFRRHFDISDVDLTPEEEVKFENAAKLTKIILNA